MLTSTTAVILKGYPRLSETFIAQELLGLEQLGHRLVIFSMRQPYDNKTHPINAEIKAPIVYLPEYLHREPMRVLRSLFRVALRPKFWRTLAGWLGDLAREPTRNRMRRFGQAVVLAAELPDDVDRLYAHFIHTPATVTHYASRMTGLAWTCSAHAKDIWTSPDWDLKHKLASVGWVATCTAVGRAHLADLAPAAQKVHLVYHGLDLERFPHFERPAATRTGEAAHDPVRLFSVGRAVEKKGFDTLLEAFARLPADLNWRWTHIGGGERIDALKQQASELGLGDRVEWLGSQAQTRVLEGYRHSDLFVLPCRIASDGDRDGLPNVLVEAQSQGLACIATPVSGIPELIQHDHHGLLVPPNDPDALAASIERLARSPDLRDQIGRGAEARVRQHFDHNAGIHKLDALFTNTEQGPEQERPDASAHAQPKTSVGVAP